MLLSAMCEVRVSGGSLTAGSTIGGAAAAGTAVERRGAAGAGSGTGVGAGGAVGGDDGNGADRNSVVSCGADVAPFGAEGTAIVFSTTNSGTGGNADVVPWSPASRRRSISAISAV